MTMIQSSEIAVLLADTYYEAAKTVNVDMRKVTEILETLRPHFTDQPVFDIWKHIRLEPADLENAGLMKLLVQMKYGYLNLIYKSVVRHIETVSAKNKEAGFTEWLRIYTEAIIHWESHIYDRMDDVAFPFSAKQLQYLKDAQRYHDYVRDNRWADCYDRYAELAANTLLPKLNRAYLHTISGQIQMFYLDMQVAMEHLEKARKLIPQPNAKIERCFGEWYLKKQEFDTARLFFMNAMSIDLQDADTYLSMGDSYRDERKWDLAIEYYQKAIAVNPLETSPYDRLINIYGEPDLFAEKEGAINGLIQKIELLNLNSPDKHFSNWRYNGYRAVGWTYYRNQKYDSAKIWYTRAAKLHPEWASAFIDLGNTFFAAGDKVAAGKQYKKAYKAASDSYDVCWTLGWFYEQEGNYTEAINWYQQCARLRPATAQSLQFIIVDIYANSLNDTAKSLSLLDELAVQYPGDVAVFEKAAAIHAKSGDPASSEAAYRKALDINPDNAYVWNEVGVIRYRQSDYLGAAECFEKAIALNTNDPVYFGNLADAWFNAGQPEKSGEVLERGVKLFSQNADLLNRIGNHWFSAGDYDAAIKYYEQAVENTHGEPVYNANLAGAFKAVQAWGPAEKFYLAALELQPGNSYYLNELGFIAFQQQAYNQAAGYFSQAFAAEPTNATYADNLAQTLALMPDRTHEAGPYYLKAAQINPGNSLIANRAGNYFLQNHDYTQALDLYLQALQTEPENGIYLANAGYAHLLLKHYQEAKEMLEKAVKLEPDQDTIKEWLEEAENSL